MMVTLVERLDSTDVTTFQEYTVIDLLKEHDGDAVIGAMALDEKGRPRPPESGRRDPRTGEERNLRHLHQLLDGTGDGFAISSGRAGLIDMEMVQFHPTGAVYPYDARAGL